MKWVIVISGMRLLVSGWLDVMKFVYFKVFVIVEEVEKGKFDLVCYCLGVS